MRRFHFLILLVCLLAPWPAYAQEISGQGGGASLTVKENDNTPTVSGVNSISFTNGTVTDDGGGAVSVTISGTGAPIDATYLTQTPNATLTNEQPLSALSNGCVGVTTTTGVIDSRTITGTANQITVTNGNCAGNPTLSIPTNPTLPGTTTGTFSGNLTGAVTGNASTATALALRIKSNLAPHSNGEYDYVNNGDTAKPGYTPYTYPHPLQGVVTSANFTGSITFSGSVRVQ